MKWNFRKIVIIASTMQLLLFCPEAAAQELSSSEKIDIIDEIVEKKIKEAKGGDALDAVLDAVAAKFPLDTDKDSPEFTAFISELQEQVRKKYPATNKELEKQFTAAAENEYPIYNTGDNISVIYLLYGKSFTVTGRYYRQDAKYVWVGSKKILKANLAKQYAPRFDPDRAQKLRVSFVEQNIRRYQQQKDFLLKMLKSNNKDKILEIRGNVLYNNKWLAPRIIVMKKYGAAFASQNNLIAAAVQKAKKTSDNDVKIQILESVIREYPAHKSVAETKNLLQTYKEKRINNLIVGAIQKAQNSSDYNEKFKILESVIQEYPNHKSIAGVKALLEKFKEIYARKTEEVKNILAYCSQPKVEPLQLKNKYGIDLTDVRLLSEVNITFRGIPDSDKLLKVLDRLQQIIAKRIISEGYKKVKAAKTYEEMFQLLREIIASCPEHTPELKAVRQFLQNTGKEYVNLMIAKAQKADNYGEAFGYLENAEKYCPDAPNIGNARALHYQYRQEMERKRAAQRRTKTCPACNGSGRIAQSGFTPGMASIGGTMTTCSTCSGSGEVSASANTRQCPVCNGRGSTNDMFTNRPIQCSHCGGSGYVN